jgi:hypothetical protein
MTDCRTSHEPVPDGLTQGWRVFCQWHAYGRCLPKRTAGTYDRHPAHRLGSDAETVAGKWGDRTAEYAVESFKHLA